MKHLRHFYDCQRQIYEGLLEINEDLLKCYERLRETTQSIERLGNDQIESERLFRRVLMGSVDEGVDDAAATETKNGGDSA